MSGVIKPKEHWILKSEDAEVLDTDIIKVSRDTYYIVNLTIKLPATSANVKLFMGDAPEKYGLADW
jgi:hypothetical protein